MNNTSVNMVEPVSIFDPSVGSTNLGDSLIMEAVNEHLDSLFPDAMKLYIPTHEKISAYSYRLAGRARYRFVGGSNLISSRMNRYHQWHIGMYDSFYLNGLILMGVGWWQYQEPANLYTRLLLRSVLHREIAHSVRDSYTGTMLAKAGFRNVINTSCPTLWNLTEEHCRAIPAEKADAVVCTVTDYNRDYKRDPGWIRLLLDNYREVYFWPQGVGDRPYMNEMKLSSRLTTLSPGLQSLDSLLSGHSGKLDYVGSRLHGGIRALQHKRRTLILGIDNRALEIANDVNLPVCPRADLSAILGAVTARRNTRLTVPFDAVREWKKQFL